MTKPDDDTQRERVQHAIEDLGEAVTSATDAAPAAARSAARREVRRLWPWLAVGNSVLVFLLLIVVTLIGGTVAGQSSAIDALTEAARQAKPGGDAANRELRERGQAPVPIPEPGQGSDTEVIVATATARVLASIPDTSPTATELGEAIARYVAANPGVVAGQVTAAVAGYLATSPPPTGPTGPAGPTGPTGEAGRDCDPAEVPQCRGPQGDPPTEAQIQTAFVDYVRANPDVLCPGGGRFTQVRLQLAGGSTADAWTCVVAEYPPPTTTTGAPPAPDPPTTTTTAVVDPPPALPVLPLLPIPFPPAR